jgi:hypothetical protein
MGGVRSLRTGFIIRLCESRVAALTTVVVRKERFKIDSREDVKESPFGCVNYLDSFSCGYRSQCLVLLPQYCIVNKCRFEI